jgi:hypothetical protein
MPQCQFLFSTVFVFQKSYTGNILRIGQNKFGNSYFTRTKDEDQTGAGERPEAGHTIGGAAQPLVAPTHCEATMVHL